jgi:hypothetical protein
MFLMNEISWIFGALTLVKKNPTKHKRPVD